MYYINYVTLTMVSISFVYYFKEPINHCISSITNKYKKFQSLNKLVSTQHTSMFSILRISVYILGQAIYYMVINDINRTVKKINKNQYEITYVVAGKVHKLISNIKRGPKKVLQIIDENNEDVTDEIEPYIGPSEDFHKTYVTPLTFKHKKLIFNTSSGNSLIFKEDQQIIL
jgi:phage anti-repressor protein